MVAFRTLTDVLISAKLFHNVHSGTDESIKVKDIKISIVRELQCKRAWMIKYHGILVHNDCLFIFDTEEERSCKIGQILSRKGFGPRNGFGCYNKYNWSWDVAVIQ